MSLMCPLLLLDIELNASNCDIVEVKIEFKMPLRGGDDLVDAGYSCAFQLHLVIPYRVDHKYQILCRSESCYHNPVVPCCLLDVVFLQLSLVDLTVVLDYTLLGTALKIGI